MLQTKIRQLFGEPAPVLEITKAFVQYSCRLCGASGVGRLYRLDLQPRQRQAIRNLKEWLDNSCYRNTLFSAVWSLTQYRKPQYRRVAAHFGLDPQELQYQFNCIPTDEKLELRQQRQPYRFTQVQMTQTMRQVERYGKYLVKQYLRYCYNNDSGVDREDFWGDLSLQGCKIIRNYEVRGLTVEEMTPLVARGLANHVKNLAIYHGKDRRNPLLRLSQRSPTKEAWYCNVTTGQVEHAWVYTSPQQRQGDYYLADFLDRDPAYIYCRRLYSTAQEADTALLEYQQGRGHARTTVLDLSTGTQDNWQPVVASLDTPADDDGAPLLSFLPTVPKAEPDYTLQDLTRNIRDPKVQMFFQAVQGDLGLMFDTFCSTTVGKSSAELSEKALVRAARLYSDVTIKQLQSLAPQ